MTTPLFKNRKNNVSFRLGAELSATSSLLMVGENKAELLGENFGQNDKDKYFLLTLTGDNGERITKREIVRVVGKNDDILSIQRAVELCPQNDNVTTSTQQAFDFSAGDLATMNLTAGDLQAIDDTFLHKDEERKNLAPHAIFQTGADGKEEALTFDPVGDVGKTPQVTAEGKIDFVTPSVDIHTLDIIEEIKQNDEILIYSPSQQKNVKISVNILTSAFIGGWYGDGKDGEIEITGGFSLARDMHYKNLVLNNATINTNGFKIFSQNNIEGVGTITGALQLYPLYQKNDYVGPYSLINSYISRQSRGHYGDYFQNLMNTVIQVSQSPLVHTRLKERYFTNKEKFELNFLEKGVGTKDYTITAKTSAYASTTEKITLFGTTGGNPGGKVILSAKNINFSGSIISNGFEGGRPIKHTFYSESNTQQNIYMPGGNGGAGGVCLILADTADMSQVSLQLKGGKGGGLKVLTPQENHYRQQHGRQLSPDQGQNSYNIVPLFRSVIGGKGGVAVIEAENYTPFLSTDLSNGDDGSLERMYQKTGNNQWWYKVQDGSLNNEQTGEIILLT